jgi:ferredoxin
MNTYYYTSKPLWDQILADLQTRYQVFAPFGTEGVLDYEVVSEKNISEIVYNKAKPSTPLKTFFLPVRENVTTDKKQFPARIIIGAPNCDVEALGILDEIYLDEVFEDIFYRERRKNTLIISSDCFDVLEHCHCLSYNIKPWASARADLAVIKHKENMLFRVISEKGREFAEFTCKAQPLADRQEITWTENKQRETEDILLRINKGLPDYKTTGKLVDHSDNSVWLKHSRKCVSCGACTTICPTCTCFLLIDKPGFHKVKQMDACQYPGFERVAGGEDALKELADRFRNRYMCKYVWKPLKFKGLTCTGCGRCIEACIGRINKNEIFRELV